MTLWQFVTFTVLIAALLVYAMVIARRLGRVDVRFKRIEEALLEKSRSLASQSKRRRKEKLKACRRLTNGPSFATTGRAVTAVCPWFHSRELPL